MVRPFPVLFFPPVGDSLVTNSCANSAMPHSKRLFIIWEQLQLVATFPVLAGVCTTYVRVSSGSEAARCISLWDRVR